MKSRGGGMQVTKIQMAAFEKSFALSWERFQGFSISG